MSEGAKGFTDPPKEHAKKGMTEAETLAFLAENGLEPLVQWKEGQPLLYVFEDSLLTDDEVFGHMSPHDRPRLVRLDAPTWFGEVSKEYQHPETGEWIRLYGVANENKGQVDYYVVDPSTRKPRIVKTSNSSMQRESPYYVRRDRLFIPNELFPKGTPES